MHRAWLGASICTYARDSAEAKVVAMAEGMDRQMRDTPQNRQGVDCLYQVIFGISIILAVFLVLLAMMNQGG